MLRILAVAALLSSAAWAEEEAKPPGEELKHDGEEVKHDGAEATHEHEHHQLGIVNWWSWDYGTYCNDGAHKDRPPPFGFAIINFALFLGLMSRILGKPLKQMVRDRHDRIKSDLEEAKKLREGALAMLTEYQKKVENVDAEVQALLDTIRKEAEAEKARIIAAAEEQALRLKADAEKQIAAEIERAKNELKRGVAEAAIAAAGEMLKKQIGADDQRKMAESYVASIEQREEAVVIIGSVARRYAKALLEIGVKQQTYDALGKELERLAATFAKSPELERTLQNPIFPLEKRRLVLDELARRLALSKVVRNFVMLLLDKGRIGNLPDVSRAYHSLVDEHANRVRATITSARPLDPALEKRLKNALEQQSGKTVILEKKEDPAILGGIVTQLGDLVYDGSVRTHLAQMREQLLSE